MSFILDALQRADAERARGAVPGLHARQVNSPYDTGRAGSRKGWALAVTGVLALALAAMAVWMWMGNPPAAVVPVASMPIAQTARTTAPTPASPAAAGAAMVTTPQAVAPPVAAAQPPKPAPMAPNLSPRRPSSAAKAPASPAKDVVAAAAPTAPLLSELPEDIRRQIPPLGISGAVYSDNPAQRLLLVNGQVLGQGSLAAPDVTLVEIRASSSEFSFRGTRFRIAH
ncbi:MAG: general secretion pathway protein GspB [Burkholderiaceae bacterium]|nr:general secretion pathway protein GspB [Burkholderiaceae bacterium]